MSEKNNVKINFLCIIKSKYILQKIFKNLEYNKKLVIMQYNKKLQEKSDLNINDYKEYLQIEIEVVIKVHLIIYIIMIE